MQSPIEAIICLSKPDLRLNRKAIDLILMGFKGKGSNHQRSFR